MDACSTAATLDFRTAAVPIAIDGGGGGGGGGGNTDRMRSAPISPLLPPLPLRN